MPRLSARVVPSVPSPAARERASTLESLGPENPSTVDAELLVTIPEEEAIVLGAFQRESEVPAELRGRVVRRATGGAAVRVGPGTIWLQLRLTNASALVPCEPARVLNRYVRPLLRALTRSGAAASYFDRDWIAVRHRPAGLVSFAHETRGAVMVEAFVAVTTPFAIDERATFRGKVPATIEELTGKSDPTAMLAAIAAAYAGHDVTPTDAAEDAGSALVGLTPVRPEPAWTELETEALGVVAAGRDGGGVLRVGGELVASRDAVAALEARIAELETKGRPTLGAIGEAVDATLGAPDAVVFGIRSLRSIAIVVGRALGAQ